MRRYYENPEAREKLSLAARHRWDNDNVARDKQSVAMRRRFATPAERDRQAAANRMAPPRGRNTSGFKGVGFFGRTNKWVAKIKIDGRSKNLGYFVCIEDAARAYDQAAIDAWGLGNCYLNFPSSRALAVAA